MKKNIQIALVTALILLTTACGNKHKDQALYDEYHETMCFVQKTTQDMLKGVVATTPETTSKIQIATKRNLELAGQLMKLPADSEHATMFQQSLDMSKCGQSNSVSTSLSQSAAAAKPAEAKPIAPKDATIKIKGLYIGMDILTVPALLKEKLDGEKYPVSDVAKVDVNDPSDLFHKNIFTQGTFYIDVGNNFVAIALKKPLSFVVATSDGKVNKILFAPDIVNELFKATDMDASDFVKQFVSAYNIPEMKMSDDLQSWAYTSPDGVKVTIDTAKTVLLEKVASAQERKQSFN